ncbi:MAG: hypothetical protein P4M08_12815 [Oligoflexia bacterium]|nr:hypothetical protein [Oligoflexia bacterium]
MTANPAELNELAIRLGDAGVAGFCATTLSAPADELRAVTEKLGKWIRREPNSKPSSDRAALPLGIHLEGPFISSGACGAHPPGAIRPIDLREVESLWEISQKTLKIMTVAPEAIAPKDRARFFRFCRDREIRLALGHSSCSEQIAREAFDHGFGGVTHAWNAMSFHHRAPGIMGAALGRKRLHIELILDQIHVSPTLLRWTLDLHRHAGPVCFVSDAAPAAGTSGRNWHPFGPLKIRFQDGASRLPDGSLAGGGILLPEAYRCWLIQEAAHTGQPIAQLLKRTLKHVTSDPLSVLSVPARRLGNRRFVWKVEENQLSFTRDSI